MQNDPLSLQAIFQIVVRNDVVIPHVIRTLHSFFYFQYWFSQCCVCSTVLELFILLFWPVAVLGSFWQDFKEQSPFGRSTLEKAFDVNPSRYQLGTQTTTKAVSWIILLMYRNAPLWRAFLICSSPFFDVMFSVSTDQPSFLTRFYSHNFIHTLNNLNNMDANLGFDRSGTHK